MALSTLEVLDLRRKAAGADCDQVRYAASVFATEDGAPDSQG